MYPPGVSPAAIEAAGTRKDEHMTSTTQFQVTGMTCAHCEASVRSEVSKLPGVAHIDVSAKTGTLVVESSTPLTDAAVIAAVDEAGYAAARA